MFIVSSMLCFALSSGETLGPEPPQPESMIALQLIANTNNVLFITGKSRLLFLCFQKINHNDALKKIQRWV